MYRHIQYACKPVHSSTCVQNHPDFHRHTHRLHPCTHTYKAEHKHLSMFLNVGTAYCSLSRNIHTHTYTFSLPPTQKTQNTHTHMPRTQKTHAHTLTHSQAHTRTDTHHTACGLLGKRRRVGGWWGSKGFDVLPVASGS